jgi:uncharacterized lipoprotein YmbA
MRGHSHLDSHLDRWLRPACCAIALALAVACGKKENQETTAQGAGGAVVPPPAAAPAAALQVADVKVGNKLDANKQVSNATDTFSPKDTIFASVHTTGTAQNAQVVARWTFQDGQTVSERTESISPTGDTYTEFHIAKPSGWPAGKYTLHVLLNGQEVQTKDFTVK